MALPDVVFDQAVTVEYGQLFLSAEDADAPVPELAFAGQANGLCGAAVPGTLYLVTGLQHGEIRLTVERHAAAPPADERAEEVVEVSFTAPPGSLSVRNADGETWPLNLPGGSYRVRYDAEGFQTGWDVETTEDDEPVGHYVLAVWPAPAAPDEIVRNTGDAAARWHRTVAPSAGATVPANAAAARLGAVRVHLGVVRAVHEPLVDALAHATDEDHRRVARWAALQALTATAIRDLPVVRPAVARLEAGEPVPPPFDDEIMALLEVGPLVPKTPIPPVVVFDHDDDDQDHIREEHALSAVSATAKDDSLEAVFAAVTQAAAAHGPDHAGDFGRSLLAAFPHLRS